MLAFWTRGFPCQDTGKENLWCPEYPDFLPPKSKKEAQLGQPYYKKYSSIIVLINTCN